MRRQSLANSRVKVVQHSVEIYGGLTALVFAILGIWLGLKITRQEEVVVVKEVAVLTTQPFALLPRLLETAQRPHLGRDACRLNSLPSSSACPRRCKKVRLYLLRPGVP